jgi:hypothetical protein
MLLAFMVLVSTTVGFLVQQSTAMTQGLVNRLVSRDFKK